MINTPPHVPLAARLSRRPKCRAAAPFTLIEIVAALIVVSLLAAVATVRIMNMSDEARRSCIYEGVRSFNGQEAQLWAKTLIGGASAANVTDFDHYI
jgi:type II secretory pathway pseudopilin PulG